MKIVIIGLGKIGRTVLENLSSEDHTITIIDQNQDKIENAIEKYDVSGVTGNGACMDIQQEAGVKNADMVIVLTNSDELNILACLVAKQLGAANTMARVRNPKYHQQIIEMKDTLGIAMIFNPEKETANELFSLISLPSVAHVEHFAKGKVTLVGILVEQGCSLIGETLISIRKKFNTRVLICAVQRGDQIFIPSGNFKIKEGDKIHFTSKSNSLGDFLSEIHLVKSPLKNIMIVGGGNIGYYLANDLSRKKYTVKLIENNKERAEELAELLPKVTIIYGDGTRQDLLMEQGLDAMDAFISLIGIDEENIIASMFAGKQQVRKVIAKIDRDELFDILKDVGISSSVSPKDIIASQILRYIRALSNKRGSKVSTLYRLVNNQVEALEFEATTRESFFDTPLKELQLKENCLIACIIRNNEVILPDGNSCIKDNDTVIVVTTHKNFDDLTDIFA